MTSSSLFSPVILKRLVAGIFLEFAPILIFLGTFPHFHIYRATMVLMIATIISTIATYRLQKRLPYLALYVALLTICFGYLTIAHHEPKFIQIRDTLYDITCAITLLIGAMINVQFLKIAFHEVIPMTNTAWRKLSYLWIAFFIINAFLNEFIRRSYGLHAWFDYKSIMLALTAIFGMVALYICYEKPAHTPHKG